MDNVRPEENKKAGSLWKKAEKNLKNKNSVLR